MVACLWAYDGWASVMCCFYMPAQWVASCLQWAAGEKCAISSLQADLGSLAEELREPQRLLPRIILAAIAIVVGCYCLVNVAYLSALSAADIEVLPK